MDPNSEYAYELDRMCDLIQSGKLPDHLIPRMFYCGHKLVSTKKIHLSPRTLKCVSCDTEWLVAKTLETLEDEDLVCPVCYTDTNTFDITEDRELVTWKCVQCSHKWQAFEGRICPMCQAECNTTPN